MKGKSTKKASPKLNKKAAKPKKAATKAKSYASKAKPSRVSKFAKTSSSRTTSARTTTSKLAKKTTSLKKGTKTAKRSATALRTINLKVKDAMHKSIPLMGPNDTLQHAARKMQEKGSGYIFVSERDRLAGIVTDRDIVLRAISYGGSKFDTLRLRDIMSPKILYCFEEDTLHKAAQNMAKNQVSQLPVLNRHKKLVGVLSIGNIAHHSAKDAGEALKKISKKTTRQI